jgi:hypothetical protein
LHRERGEREIMHLLLEKWMATYAAGLISQQSKA